MDYNSVVDLVVGRRHQASERVVMAQATKARREPRRRDATVRIDRHTDAVLSDLAKQRHEDKKRVIAYSVEMLRRASILEQLCDAYQELRSDPVAWAQEEAERAAWQSASLEVIKNE